MPVVLDASAIVELVLGSRTGAIIRRRVSDPGISLHAPELLDLEVLNVVRRYVLAGKVEEDRAATAVRHLFDLDLERHRHGPLLSRIWSWRSNLTTYDASYVTLAEVLDAPLLTADGRLANAPHLRTPVEVFTAAPSC
ncbi:MAG: type II toxin-antitoxin system VapC family toxin [Acidobacteria bacterium]|nr:type II toxin-antitoxin system VapC family toxin [Acidobacteriota bacterium]